MAKGFSIPTGWLIGGAILAGGAFLLITNPNIIQNLLHPPSGMSSPVQTSATPAAPTTMQQVSSVVTPPLSQIEQGGIIPYQQNAFCDPTLGLNWDPLQGKCVQSLQSRSGNCAQGSHFDHYQCQCVPNGILQPQGYRDCTVTCKDKINQVWSWCVNGCIPKSAAYGDPSLLACPPK